MRYLARRLMHSTLILLAISFLSFALLQWGPGEFFDVLRMNPRVSAQTIRGLRAQYGLDQPLGVRYGRWMRSVFKGDMGFSFSYNSAIGPLLWARARNTLLLTSSATLLAWLAALVLGIWGATRKGRWVDRICGVATSTFVAIPDLLVFLLLLWFAARTGWFPTGGMTSPSFEELRFWDRCKDVALHLALPALGLAAVMLPILLRHVRAAMIEALEAPFVRAARGHGIPPGRVVWRYALPAASNPLISLLGYSVAGMLSGAAIVEVILSWPGLGPLMVQSVLARDVFVVLDIVLWSSALLVASNLLADLLLFASDPRIRME
jgi:peptide/nickel transport system permease protein